MRARSTRAAPTNSSSAVRRITLDDCATLGDEFVEVSRPPCFTAQHQRRLLHRCFGVTLERASPLFNTDKLIGLVEHNKFVRGKQPKCAQFVEEINHRRTRAVEIKSTDFTELSHERFVKAAQALKDEKRVLSVKNHESHRRVRGFSHDRMVETRALHCVDARACRGERSRHGPYISAASLRAATRRPFERGASLERCLHESLSCGTHA